MNAHRVVDNTRSIAVMLRGSIIIDNKGRIFERIYGCWVHSDEAYEMSQIVLPARVLMESWER